jgi:hypothetical protein
MLNWLDGMRESFGRVTLKHIKVDGYEAGSEACVSRGTESNLDVARRVATEHACRDHEKREGK